MIKLLCSSICRSAEGKGLPIVGGRVGLRQDDPAVCKVKEL